MIKFENFRLNLALGIFVGLLVGMNLLGAKVTELFGVSVSVAIFMIPIIFVLTDVITELYGRDMTRQFALIGVIVLAMTLIYTAIFTFLPAHERYAHDDSYRTIFGSSTRIIIASLTAFLLAEFNDIWVFKVLKKATKGRFLWIRSFGSTVVSQGVDTFIFMMIAFYAVSPKFTFLFTLTLGIPYYLFKIAFAFLFTPLIYAGVRFLKNTKKEGEDVTPRQV